MGGEKKKYNYDEFRIFFIQLFYVPCLERADVMNLVRFTINRHWIDNEKKYSNHLVCGKKSRNTINIF